MKGYKGFDKDLRCQGMQYSIGETATHHGNLKLCNSGLHFCENPLDVLAYYPPSDSRFAEIEADEVANQNQDDNKRVAKSLHIKAELSLSALLAGGIKFILDKVDFTNSKESNTGDRSAATNTGDRSAATNTGKDGTAISLGVDGCASGSIGNFLVLAEWQYKDRAWRRVAMGLAKVDGKKIKADTFYVLKGGKFTEV